MNELPDAFGRKKRDYHNFRKDSYRQPQKKFYKKNNEYSTRAHSDFNNESVVDPWKPVVSQLVSQNIVSDVELLKDFSFIKSSVHSVEITEKETETGNPEEIEI